MTLIVPNEHVSQAEYDAAKVKPLIDCLRDAIIFMKRYDESGGLNAHNRECALANILQALIKLGIEP